MSQPVGTPLQLSVFLHRHLDEEPGNVAKRVEGRCTPQRHPRRVQGILSHIFQTPLRLYRRILRASTALLS